MIDYYDRVGIPLVFYRHPPGQIAALMYWTDGIDARGSESQDRVKLKYQDRCMFKMTRVTE